MADVASLPDRVRSFYQRVNHEREAALSDLPALYAPDVHFINPVVDQRGLAAFEAVWRRAFSMYAVFEFRDVVATGNDERFMLAYSMSIQFGVGPVFTTDMMTDCQGTGGRVTRCRDYFDPLGTLVGPFGPMRWVYRAVFRRLVA